MEKEQQNFSRKRYPVNKIIPFSSVDGPGNRTSVFLQGCNFDCRYCHNPETRNICTDCGACVQGCPAGALSMEEGSVRFDPARCVGCDTCIKTCTFGASPRIRYMMADQVMAEVEKQVPYIRGITVSGGECSLYPDFLQELFTLAKEKGLGTLIDSNGSLDFGNYPDLLNVADGVMLDVKAWTAEDHRKVTGRDNAMVRKNLDFLASAGKLYEVRTVVVPDLFDVKETVRQTALAIAPYLDRHDIRYKIITYRPMGVRREYSSAMKPPSGDLMQELEELAGACGVRNVITV